MATSGKTILGKRITDWAFIKLDGTAYHYFKPNEILFVVPEEHQPRHYDPNLDASYQNLGSPLTGFDTLEKGGYYVKLGRSTGVLLFSIHPARETIVWNTIP